MSAAGAPVTADRDHQRRGTPTEWLVGEPPGHGVARGALASAATTPLVRFEDPARQDRTVRLELLADNFEPELIESAEGGQISAGEARADASVGHVEDSQMSV